MDRFGHQRRKALTTSALAAFGLACSRMMPAWAEPAESLDSAAPMSAQTMPAQPMPAQPMFTRAIPGTGERLPVIGIGANFFGGIRPEEMVERRDILRRLAQLGNAVVDTAQSYGQTETLLGRMIAELGIRDQLFIATKMPLGGDARPPDAAIETSRLALQLQYIDLLNIHNLYRFDAYLPALRRAKEARRIRYLGVTASALQLKQLQALLRKHPVDFIQVGYSLGNRLAEPVIAAARERGIAVLVGEPFGGRRRAESVFATVRDQPLPDWAAEIDASSWAQVMLKYSLSLPGVLTVTPGTDSLAHLNDNLTAGQGRLPDAAIRRDMERYWDALRTRKRET